MKNSRTIGAIIFLTGAVFFIVYGLVRVIIMVIQQGNVTLTDAVITAIVFCLIGFIFLLQGLLHLKKENS